MDFYKSEYAQLLQGVLEKPETLFDATMNPNVFPTQSPESICPELRNYFATMLTLLEQIGFTCQNPLSAAYTTDVTRPSRRELPFWKQTNKVQPTDEFLLLQQIIESFSKMGFANHALQLFNTFSCLIWNRAAAPPAHQYYKTHFVPWFCGIIEPELQSKAPFQPRYTSPLLSAVAEPPPPEIAALQPPRLLLVRSQPKPPDTQGREFEFPTCHHNLISTLKRAPGEKPVLACPFYTQPSLDCHFQAPIDL